MANGDAAVAAGLTIVASSADRRLGYDEINKTRDYVAAEMAARASADAGKASTTHTHAASDVTSGTLSSSRIPDLAASKITSGTLSNSRLATDLGAKEVDYARGPTAGSYARAATGSGWYSVYMNSDLLFMRNTSSCRYKESIEPLELDLGKILALEPVTYHRKGQPPGTREVGLIAERCVDVPGLVTWDVPRDRKGQPIEGRDPRPEAVRYEQVLPVLLLHVIRDQQERLERLERVVDGILTREREREQS